MAGSRTTQVQIDKVVRDNLKRIARMTGAGTMSATIAMFVNQYMKEHPNKLWKQGE